MNEVWLFVATPPVDYEGPGHSGGPVAGVAAVELEIAGPSAPP